MAAQVHVVTRKEKKAKQRASFKIVCKGVSQEEFFELCSVFRDNFGCTVVLRNPSPLQFDANTVHQIVLCVMGSALSYAAKPVIDAAKELFVAYIKFRFLSASDDAHRGEVKVLYGPDDNVLYEIKEKKPKKKSR